MANEADLPYLSFTSGRAHHREQIRGAVAQCSTLEPMADRRLFRKMWAEDCASLPVLVRFSMDFPSCGLRTATGCWCWCPVSKRLWERTAACASRPNYVTGKDLSVDSRSCPLLLDCAIAINRRKAPLTCRLNLVCLFCTCTCQSFDGSTSGLTVPLPTPSINR